VSGESKKPIVRLLTPDDARGVPELATRVYGAAYFHTEVFTPEELLEKNRRGELTSAVAIDEQGRVLGHCALERPNLERFVKIGEAMVLPEARQHHLLARTGALLLREAERQGRIGVYAEPVTHHVFSQLAFDSVQGVPTGLKLGAWVVSGFGIDFPQRVTPAVYFKYFRLPEKTTVYLPERHQETAGAIFSRLGREVAFGNAPMGEGAGELRSNYDRAQRAGYITVVEAGSESTRRVDAARAALIAEGAEAIFVDIFIDNPAAPRVCDELESSGLFFSGIQPDIKEDRDLIRLQTQVTPIDLKLVQASTEFGRELLDYVGRERARLAGSSTH
jgi:hypothetical protein